MEFNEEHAGWVSFLRDELPTQIRERLLTELKETGIPLIHLQNGYIVAEHADGSIEKLEKVEIEPPIFISSRGLTINHENNSSTSATPNSLGLL